MIKNNIIEVRDLSFDINNKRILKNISVDIKEGEFIGLIGPNGAGKSTFLKALNGINEVNQGTVRIKGKLLSELGEKEIARNIALMNQNTSVSFSFPCIDIVVMGRYPYLNGIKGFTKNDKNIAEKYMNYTNTLQFKDRSINELSGGERQRVLFSKVLTQETDIILLDEPTASLDISNQEQLFNYSYDLVQKGKTVIAAVHDLRTAIKYCSRLLLMVDGKIIKDGLAHEVLTEKNISKAYGIDTKVYINPYTNMLDYYTI